ncbi:MAG TPA: DNA repair protein RadC [bacterium]|nr:DNA repair protein RadC [bacterium]
MRVTSNLTDAAGAPSLFFVRLAEWDEAVRAAETFDRVLNNPVSVPQPVFYSRLYQHLIEYLLDRLQLPSSHGAAEWEWKPLYQFGQSVDPYYFTESAVQELLERWPVIGYENRQILTSVLMGFFHLRRSGFPACYPSALLPVHEIDRWTRIFPPEWSWDCVQVLRRMGFATMSSRQGYRTFVRFTDGLFDADLDATAMRRWQSECWRAGPITPGAAHETVAPYQANFIASSFTGVWGAMGFNGPCSFIPDCANCPLSGDCRWFHAPVSERPGPSEVLALARRGHVEHLRTDQLLGGLYDLKEQEAVQLRSGLTGDSLRALAAMSFQELDATFGQHWLLPERLSVTFEVCRRFNEERMAVGGAFQTPWDVFKHFRIRLRDLKQEQFIVVLLDNKKRYLNGIVITQGTLNTSPVHPREVFNAAIRERAASVVIVHNHPSGDPQPSKEDIHVTRQLIKVGELVGIPVLDHIIIADELYISMLEQGLMKD